MQGEEQCGIANGLMNYGARFYDPSVGRFMSVDPLADDPDNVGFSPYAYVWNNPLKFIDPTGMKGEGIDDWVEDKNGKIYWDQNATSQATSKTGETYLGKAVVVMDGSGGENLDANGKLTGAGANSAQTTVYGPGGASDVQTYDGLTVSSDPTLFTPIASGDYEGYHQQMSSAPFAKGSLTYRIKQLNGSHTIPTEGGALNSDPYSKNFGTPWKTDIFFHRTNNNGFAGARSQKVAVSKGCPVICAPQWKGVEKQLGKISSFRLRIIR